MKRNLLLTPGPTPVPEAVRKELEKPIIHHRTPQYRKYFASASERLKEVFLTKNPVYTFSGSGTLAMEASVVNFHSQGDAILVIDAGKFGERWTKIGEAYGLKCEVLKYEYGEPCKPEDIRAALEKNPEIKSVYVELCETSTGVVHPIEEIGKITKEKNVLLIADAVSGLAADRCYTDKWNVDMVVAGSQKALMLPPGLAFLSVSDRAKKQMESATLPRFFTDLRLYEKGMKDHDTPFTPAVGLVIALDKALEMILDEGIENVFARCENNAAFTREKLEAIGLKLFSKSPSATLTAAVLPEGIDGVKLVKIMRDEKGVSMAGGQAHLKGKIVRICHMGAITREDIETGIKVLEETLQEMKVEA